MVLGDGRVRDDMMGKEEDASGGKSSLYTLDPAATVRPSGQNFDFELSNNTLSINMTCRIRRNLLYNYMRKQSVFMLKRYGNPLPFVELAAQLWERRLYYCCLMDRKQSTHEKLIYICVRKDLDLKRSYSKYGTM